MAIPELPEIVRNVADVLKTFDSEKPVFKEFQPGIGPYGEPQLVREIAHRLNGCEGKYTALTKRTPDLLINGIWAVEFKIVRPYGDNGIQAENWSVNMLHPYKGNVSTIGDALKLRENFPDHRKCVFVIGYEHATPVIPLEPLILSFEKITSEVIGIHLGPRIDEVRTGLVHPVHQVVRCLGWEILP
ncbi:MAG TPA: hypothetical protein VF813_01785 [Anaerolineaceae bacterium]